MATLLTIVEAKSKTVSHERLLEVLNNEHVQVRKAFSCGEVGKFFRFTLTSDLKLSTDPYFNDAAGISLLGQGTSMTDGNGWITLLHQWKLIKTIYEPDGEPILKKDALTAMKAHIDNHLAWIETSRGW